MSSPVSTSSEASQDEESDDASAKSDSSTPSSSSSSESSQVKVNVYNINNKKKIKNFSSPTYGTLRLKERLPEKWQMSPATTSGEASTPKAMAVSAAVGSNTPIPRGLAGELGKQAATPGAIAAAAEENLKKQVTLTSYPTLSSLKSSATNPPASPHRAGGSNNCIVPSPLLKSFSHPSLRSSLKRSGTSSDASSGSSQRTTQSARLSLCSDPMSPHPATSTKLSASSRAAAASKSTSSLVPSTAPKLCTSISTTSILSRSSKRDREDDDSTSSLPSSKKMCTECGTVDSVSDKRTRTSSNIDTENNVLSNTCSFCSRTIIPPSSPKSPKNKASHDSLQRSKKGDDIQSPVISSSCVSVSRKNSPGHGCSPNLPKRCRQDRKTGRSSAENKSQSCVVNKRIGRTRSAMQIHHSFKQLDNKTLSTTSLTSTINNSVWSNNNNMKPSASTTTCRGNKGTSSSHATTDASCPEVLTSPVRRVLKSVNRSSSNTVSSPPAEHSSIALIKEISGNIQGLKTPKKSTPSKYERPTRKKRSLSVPSLLFSADAATAPPPKKKSAKMYLRSGKPMVTRSQEKTCKK